MSFIFSCFSHFDSINACFLIVIYSSHAMNSRLLFLFLYYYENRQNPRTSTRTLKDASASHAGMACGRTGFSDAFQGTLLAVKLHSHT